MRFQDLTGQLFGRLRVVNRAANKGLKTRWNCVCECDTPAVVLASSLKSGKQRSCGCLHREWVKTNLTKHLASKTLTYSSWMNMKQRCLNPNGKYHSYYIGKGITICQRWVDSFENFLSDMGARPSLQYTLERIDSNGHYTPENCKWATMKEQVRNRCSVRIFTYKGQSLTIPEWAVITGINKFTLRGRLASGWPIERALTP